MIIIIFKLINLEFIFPVCSTTLFYLRLAESQNHIGLGIQITVILFIEFEENKH